MHEGGIAAGGADSELKMVMRTADTVRERPLDPPRAQGIVGERFDGFAVLRKKASNAIKSLVKRTNDQRRAVYRKRAKATKTSIQAVGRIYAKEIMKSAPRGTWYLNESGKWTKKK